MISSTSGVTSSECFLDDGPMPDWKRLGSYVVARRVKLGFKQRGDFSAAVGVSARVLSDLENGRRGNFDAVTVSSIEDVLGWETGSVDRIADGGEPRLKDDGVPVARTDQRTSAEIEMIYASRTMTAREKLLAIRMVLDLQAQVDAETRTPADRTTESDAEKIEP